MHHLIVPFGFGFAGVAALWGLASLAFPLFVIWMVVDGVLRKDAEYPGTDPNRKVLWVVFMVLVNVAAVAYFFMMFLKVRRGASPAYTTAPPA